MIARTSEIAKPTLTGMITSCRCCSRRTKASSMWSATHFQSMPAFIASGLGRHRLERLVLPGPVAIPALGWSARAARFAHPVSDALGGDDPADGTRPVDDD